MLIQNCINQAKQVTSRIKYNRRQYNQYSTIIKKWEKRLYLTACTDIEICKTNKKVVKKNGFLKETLRTLQTTEFIEKFHRFLRSKGYETPKKIYFVEDRLPRFSGLAGESFGRNIIYNPRCIEELDFRIPIHETGHLSRHISNFSFNIGKDNYLHDFGKVLKKIPFIKKLFKEHQLCHLSKEEQITLKKDYARAYKEGYFKNNPFYKLSQERVKNAKNKKDACILNNKMNRMARLFRKNPEEYYLPNSLLNREEFIADYFYLASQGFEFSPIIKARYEKYGGPKTGKILTKEEIRELANLRKEILHKTINDYGFDWKES